MSLKMEYHSKWNVTKMGILLKIKCHLNLNVVQNGMSIKNELLRKTECLSKWNVTQNEMFLKMKCLI